MTPQPIPHRAHRLGGAAALVLSLCLGAAAWADGDAPLTAAQRYQQERAACLSGQTHQARDVCLREASNAYAAARKNQLTGPDADVLRANALKRCEPLPAEDKEACTRRVLEGPVSGSVGSGGELLESREVVSNPEAGASQPMRGQPSMQQGQQGHAAMPGSSASAPAIPPSAPAHPAQPR